MKTAAAFTTLIASTFAQGYFSAISARSASPIHLLSLNANGGKFILGGNPSPYCPSQVGDVCTSYPGNVTVLAGGEGGLSLGVIVPGGQQVYIGPDGAMSYTTAHSAYIPTGSIRDGWSRNDVEGASFGELSFSGGLVACPTTEGQPWQVYGQIPNVTLSSQCLGFDALTVNSTQPGAWQY